MDYIFLFSMFLFLIVGAIISKTDKNKGIIPNKFTHPLIFIGVILNFIRYGFSLEFYKFFTILILLYFIFECFQRILHLLKNEIGTGDIKFLLAFYSLFPFSATVFSGIPLINIIGFVCIGIGTMVLFKLGYLLFFQKIPKFKLLMDSTMNQTSIRLAPLIYFSAIVFFIFF